MTLTNPRPKESEAGKYYQSTSYISHTSAAAGIMDYIYLIVRRFTLGWKHRLVRPHLTTNALLDVGCGTGHFLNHCAKSGINAFGVEPSPDARAAAQNNQVVESIAALPDQKFSVITMWHVLEHIYNLDATIEELKSKLAEDGTIFIAVPNRESYDANLYKELWAAFDVPRHVWHFTKKDMTSLMEQHGLKVKQILPMRLDAYYVSMLSEKNSADGTLSLSSAFRAISAGFRSNSNAKKENNYSSLIYLLQK